jgi:cytidylate kinase
MQMKIKNNILKQHLKNVYWIGGTSCSGKITMASMIAKKHNFYHYDADKMFNSYRKIASSESQPALAKQFNSVKEYFLQPLPEYLEYLENINRESFDMLVVDVLKLAQQKNVIVEGHYPPELMYELAPRNRIALFITSEDIIRRDYFERKDKQNMLAAIQKAAGNEDFKSHVIDVTVAAARKQIQVGKRYNYKIFERTQASTVEKTLAAVEQHFGINKNFNGKQ